MAVVTSIAELRRFRRTENVVVEGYDTAGDGGGGSFYWDRSSTTADDYGTVIKPDGWTGQGRFKRIFTGGLDPRWFGAKGNDVADDSVAMRRAIAAAEAIADHPPVLIPAGCTFRVGDLSLNSSAYAVTDATDPFVDSIAARAVMFLDFDGAHLKGSGPTSKIHWAGGSRFVPAGVSYTPDGAGSPVTSDGTGIIPINYDANLQNLTAVMGGTAGSLIVYRGNDITIEGVYIYGDNGDEDGTNARVSDNYQRSALTAYHGNEAKGTWQRTIIQNCTFANLFAFSQHGGFFEHCEYRGNRHRYCANGVNPAGDWWVFEDCDFLSAEGLELSASHLRVSRCTFRGISALISLTGNPVGGSEPTHDIQISDCIWDCTDTRTSLGGNLSALVIDSCFDVTVTNITILNPQLNGIAITGLNGVGSRISVNGVTVRYDDDGVSASGSVSGVYVASGTHISISGVKVFGNGDMDFGFLLNGGNVKYITVSDSHVVSCKGDGFYSVNIGNDLVVSNVVCLSNTHYGFHFEGTNGARVSKCHAASNGTKDFKTVAGGDGVTDIRMTSCKYSTVEDSASALIDLGGNGASAPPLLSSPQALSGAGAINLTTRSTRYTSTGAAQALTIADGSYTGQRKSITHAVDGGSGVITAGASIHLADGVSTITFTNVRDWVELEWNGSAWAVVAYGGVTIA